MFAELAGFRPWRCRQGRQWVHLFKFCEICQHTAGDSHSRIKTGKWVRNRRQGIFKQDCRSFDFRAVHPNCYPARKARGAVVSAALLPSPASSDCAFTHGTHVRAVDARPRFAQTPSWMRARHKPQRGLFLGAPCAVVTPPERAGPALSFVFSFQGTHEDFTTGKERKQGKGWKP